MVQAQTNIEGRGGAAFTYLGSSGLSHEYLLVAGASRERQFDDFWSVKVTMEKEGLKVTQSKLKLKETDGFSSRNGLQATVDSKAGTVYLFGG